MSRFVFLFSLIFLLSSCSLTLLSQREDIPMPCTKIIFNDAVLEAAVKDAMGVTGDVCEEDADSLTWLEVKGKGVSDLTGLERFANLTYLNFENNSIVNLAPLSGLNKLTQLWLSGNLIMDISPLAGLTNLEMLSVNQNQISDISIVSGLPKLTLLHLADNTISDISAISGLTTVLKSVNFSRNLLDGEDMTVLAGLTNLTDLMLDANWSIGNISSFSTLTKLTTLSVAGTGISDISVLENMPSMKLLYLADNGIVDISSLSGLTHLTNLNLNNNAVVSITPLMTNYGAGGLIGTYVILTNNPLSDAAIADANTLFSNGVNVTW